MVLRKKIVSGLLCTALLAPVGVLAQESGTAFEEMIGPMPQTDTVLIGPQKNTDSVSDAADSEDSQEDASLEDGSASESQDVIFGPMAETYEDQSSESTDLADGESAGDALEDMITIVNDTVTLAMDCDVLDYPGRKDGVVIGEVLEQDELQRTGTIDETWSRVVFQDDSGQEQTGYIPTSVLAGYDSDALTADSSADSSELTGSIHESSGEGVFADATYGVTSVNGSGTAAFGVLVGTPVSVSSEASLVDLGIFKITHYCPCSICCGPYADGITATGVTAVTNHTIAVDPTVIPYGTKVVVNGQVYVAEDCGGAIKGNRIDIYVGSHTEGEEKGTYNTEVYLLQEG